MSSIGNNYYILILIIAIGVILYFYNYYNSDIFITIESSNNPVILNPNLKVVILLHSARKNFKGRISAINQTWLSTIPDWAQLEFYTTIYDGIVPLTNYSTILVDTKEEPHRGNEQFFIAIKELYRKYVNVQAFLKIDDDTYVNWKGLKFILEHQKMWEPSIIDKKNIKYVGNCNCKIIHNSDGLYCKDLRECSLLDYIPDFQYVCGGSGILFNRQAIKVLLDYETTIGCPYSVEDVTIGHCLLIATNHSMHCSNQYKYFLSMNNRYEQKWLKDKRNTRSMKASVVGIETGYHQEISDLKSFFNRMKHHSFATPHTNNNTIGRISNSTISISNISEIQQQRGVVLSGVREGRKYHHHSNSTTSTNTITSTQNYLHTSSSSLLVVNSSNVTITNPTIKIVIMMHVSKHHYRSHIRAIHQTWLSLIPDWAQLEFYTTIYDGIVPLTNYSTILVDTKEEPHRGNEQFFIAIKELYRKYVNVQAFLKIDDHTYLNWKALQLVLVHQKMWEPSILDKKNIKYVGNCNCKIIHNSDGLYCKNEVLEECGSLNNIPDFQYVCGGSGILFNRQAIKVLLDYETTIGCPYSVEDVTIGHCLLKATNFSDSIHLCHDASDHFLSMERKKVHDYLIDPQNDVIIKKKAVTWKISNAIEYKSYFNRLKDVIIKTHNTTTMNMIKPIPSSITTIIQQTSNHIITIDSTKPKSNLYPNPSANFRPQNILSQHNNIINKMNFTTITNTKKFNNAAIIVNNNNNNNNNNGITMITKNNIFQQECRMKFGNRSFLPTDQLINPPMLYTFPGSGNTWGRLLVEYATGIYTGSLYGDSKLIDVLPGEYDCNRKVSLVKVHPSAHPFIDMKCCVKIPTCMNNHIHSFQRAVLLIRNPYDSIWSEYQRGLLLDHVGGITKKSFNRNHFENAAIVLARDYAIMGKIHYLGVEKDFERSNWIYIRYENLLNQSLRINELYNMVSFLNITPYININQINCAFILADNSQTHRNNINNPNMITKKEAFQPRFICELWHIFGSVATKYKYLPYLNHNCTYAV